MERYELTEIQAQAILDMRLQRLTGLEILALRREYAETVRLIEKLEEVLASETKLYKVIKEELKAIAAQHGDDRRTALENAEDVIEAVVKEETVAEEAVVVFTQSGHLRRMHPRHYRRLPPVCLENDNIGDTPRFFFETDTDRTLFMMTNHGNCYTVSVGALPEMNKPREKGSLLTGVLSGLEAHEDVVCMFCCLHEELRDSPDLLFITKRGIAKRTVAGEYDVRRQKFAAIKLRPDDSVLAVLRLAPALDMLCISRMGMSIRFHTDSLPVMGRVTGGVRAVSLEPGDELLWAVQPEAPDQVLLLTDRGFGKRILYMDFDPQARAGKGVKSFYFNKSGSNGTCIAGILLLKGTPATMLVTQQKSSPSVMDTGTIMLQSKQDKGMPCVMALLDDTVTGIQPYSVAETLASEETDGADE